MWQRRPIAVDPVVHRLKWGDLDGDGRAELIHVPIFGRGSDGKWYYTTYHFCVGMRMFWGGRLGMVTIVLAL